MSTAISTGRGGFPASETLKLLSIDGGGVKGLTALLILKRIMRTVKIEGNLETEPRPCQVFDLIGGNSTGGLIAIMLGRLGMTIDECIASYIKFGEIVFGQKPIAGNAGKLVIGTFSKSFYSTPKLQNAIRTVVTQCRLDENAPFLGTEEFGCKTIVCVTRQRTAKAELLRNYETEAADQENYSCSIWEAGSATAAAPMFFESVTFKPSGAEFVDGGLRRNNPINEVIREARSLRAWSGKEIGCVISLGTGWTDPSEVPARLDKFLRKCIDIATDSDEVADEFIKSPFGKELFSSSRYYRFSVQQGMSTLQMDDWKETESMNALTINYLAKAEIGVLVERCARSILNPSLNIQIESSPLPCLLPFGLCNNFVARRFFLERLEDFFQPSTESIRSSKIFVLWGLGGVGKTQIALDFALSQNTRFSILWVRADRIENFMVDYRKILELLDPSKGASISANDPKDSLDAAVRVMESRSLEWLLVLDNADDLNLFRQPSPDGICINDCLPNLGSILITTRDSRFVGEISNASDGLQVRSMNSTEAEQLLLCSIPPELRPRETESPNEDVVELTKELGNLPLAIAQAAANIQCLRSGLHAYVELYKEKKRRHELLEEPVRDKRRPPQSVLLTWQISFEHVQASDPVAAELLCYLGFLHWENIPGSLVRLLPGLEDLDSISFSKTVARLLHLSLLEQPSEDEFQVHPMVHYWISARLQVPERISYIKKTLGVMAYIFPANSWHPQRSPLCLLLLSHALEIFNQATDLDLTSRLFARLMQVVANFLMHRGVVNWALRFITRALNMGLQVWNERDISLIYIRKFRARCLARAARYPEAIAEFRRCLVELDSVETSEVEKSSERFYIRRDLASALTDGEQNAEAEALRREFLTEEQPSSDTEPLDSPALRKMVEKHNLCNTLLRLGKIQEAKILAIEVLDWAETSGKNEVAEVVILPWLNSKAAIASREGDNAQALQIYNDVLQRSLRILGPNDYDLWVAGLNVCCTLRDFRRFEELEDIANSLFNLAAKIMLEGEVLDNAITLLNLLAITKQRVGKYQEAVNLHRIVLVWSDQLFHVEEAQSSFTAVEGLTEESTDPSHHIYIYNLCLALARQGLIKEMEDIRMSNRAGMKQAESEYGSIEARLERDRKQEEIYQEAKERLLNGHQNRAGEWWDANKETIELVEDRLGRLDSLINLTSEQTASNAPETLATKKKSRIMSICKILDIRTRKTPK